MNRLKKEKPSSSWEPVGKWYNKIVGEEGHYYHQNVILPAVLRLLKGKEKKILDLGCGQGILSRALGDDVEYCGVDISDSLIREAKKLVRGKKQHFYVGDVSKPLPVKSVDFTDAAIILALQNIRDPLLVFQQASHHLVEGGKFVIVLNHPFYRIPRQSHWAVDDEKKIQYRRVDRYLSPLEVPIQAAPSKGKSSEQTWSYHYPLSAYVEWLKEAGFWVDSIEEWCSDKESTGKAAKMENRARKEIPLFMAIVAVKKRTGDYLKT